MGKYYRIFFVNERGNYERIELVEFFDLFDTIKGLKRKGCKNVWYQSIG